MAVLLFLLMSALVVEHWVVPGGFSVAVRTGVVCGVLATGCGYFAFRRLWPLVRAGDQPGVRGANDRAWQPALKNSLINLLLFRQRRTDISGRRVSHARRASRARADSRAGRYGGGPNRN